MATIIGILIGVSTVFAVAACGNDDNDEAADVGEFCSVFQTMTPALGAPGLGGMTETVFGDLVAFFGQLDAVAPPEISTEVSTVADGLERLADAFAEYEGAAGEQAFEAVREAAEVDLDALAEAADEVEQFATRNCDLVGDRE